MTKPRDDTRRSFRLYARILRCVTQPRTAREVAQALGAPMQNTVCTLRAMRDVGLVHIGSYTDPDSCGRSAARHHFGPGANLPRPISPRTGRPQRLGHNAVPQPIGRDLRNFAAVIELVREQPSSCADVAELAGVSRGSVERLFRFMLGLGILRVAVWMKRIGCNGAPTALYELAVDKRSAPRPAPVTRAERWKRQSAIEAERRQHLALVHATAGSRRVRLSMPSLGC